jgi:hypothetical protein
MKQQIQEASLSRVWQHAESDRPIALLTGFRGEYDNDENIRRNKQLAASIRKLGYGYFFVDGYWIENEGTPEEVHVAEDSIFVIGQAGTDEEFKSQMVHLGAEYGQDGVLVKTVDGANIYDKSGGIMFNVGTLAPGKASEIYTRLRTNKKSNTFVFESERDDMGWLQRLAGNGK